MKKNIFDDLFDFNDDGKADWNEMGMGLDVLDEMKEEKKKKLEDEFEEDDNF